ncbi:MAG TPA: hypothetical protein VGP06_02510 [Janthinobacterium sp.]|nr:hypothetical protein [Janthinobacterium sp.]
MRRYPGQALRVGVAPGAVSLLLSSRWRGDKLALLAEQAVEAGGGDFNALGLALNQVFQGGAYAGWPVSFVLADELTRLWPVTPPQGVTGLADLEGAAALRFQLLYGEAPGAWKMLADWDSRAPFFAAAVPLRLLAALEQVAAANKLAIVETVPHFVNAWNRWRGALTSRSWFGLVHDNLLTLGALQGKHLCAVRVLPLPHGAGHHWLGQALAREALLLDLAPPARLQLCGQVPQAWGKPALAGEAAADPSRPQLQVSVLDASQRAALAGLSAAAALALSGSAA